MIITMINCLCCLICALQVVNCGILSDAGGGYDYPQPIPPIQLDEPSTPSNIYLPPIQGDEFVFPPAPTYLPPNIYPPIGTPPSSDDSVVIPSLYQTPPFPQLRIVNMTCEMNNYFKTMIKVEGRISAFPVVDDAPESCVTSGPVANFFRIEMEGPRMSHCGVKRCDSSAKSNMCVTLRMPTVRNLKLPEDGLVTLQCSPQDNVVSHIKHLRLGLNTNRARSNGIGNPNIVGGSQRNFNSKITIHRKSPGSTTFDQILQPGSTVNLGEELVLRAAVQDADGWQYSRIGAVMVRSSSSQRSLTLIEENGCRSPGLRVLIPQQPHQVSPLVTLLHFRAFLFQGATRGDEMLLSVRMFGCIHSKDCYQVRLGYKSCPETFTERSTL